jgi:hypothetical protein
LEELLYESAPLNSKPVKKKKNRLDAPALASLWEDEYSISMRKAAAVKLEQEMEYIEEYFQPYARSRVGVMDNSLMMQMPRKKRSKNHEVVMERTETTSSSKSSRSNQKTEIQHIEAPPIIPTKSQEMGVNVDKDLKAIPSSIPTQLKIINRGYNDSKKSLTLNNDQYYSDNASVSSKSRPIELIDMALSELDLDFPEEENPSLINYDSSHNINRFRAPDMRKVKQKYGH